MEHHLMKQATQTPIEVLLAVDEDGKVSARNVYRFLELNPSNYAKWTRKNILDNDFAEENVDWFYSYSSKSEIKRGNFAQNFMLTVTFAKKLCMKAGGVRGEQAREYFIQVENRLRQLMTNMPNSMEDFMIYQLGEMKQIEVELSAVKEQSLVQRIKIDEVLNKVTINSRQKAKLVSYLKARLTYLTGELVECQQFTGHNFEVLCA